VVAPGSEHVLQRVLELCERLGIAAFDAANPKVAAISVDETCLTKGSPGGGFPNAEVLNQVQFLSPLVGRQLASQTKISGGVGGLCGGRQRALRDLTGTGWGVWPACQHSVGSADSPRMLPVARRKTSHA
jgi:hypothetical protein